MFLEYISLVGIEYICVRQFEMLSKQFLSLNEASMTAISHKNREREKFPPFVGDVVVK